MTKFRKVLRILSILSVLIGISLLAYSFLVGSKASKQDTIILIVVFSLWILPSLFAAVWLFSEKLTITNDKIVKKNLFGKKAINKGNFKKLKIIYGDAVFKDSTKVLIIPHDVPDSIVEGKGYDNYVLLVRKDKRILRFPLDPNIDALLIRHGWKH